MHSLHPHRAPRRAGALVLCLASLFTLKEGTSRSWVPLVARRASEWGRAATEEELKQQVPTLYVYDHCPFCVRARMIFGLKRMPFKLDFLMNDDVVTPTKMTGKKVLPILEMDGEAMGESLDIVAKIDAIGTPILAKAADRKDIDQWLKDNKDLMRTGVLGGCLSKKHIINLNFKSLIMLRTFHFSTVARRFVCDGPHSG